MIQRKDQLPARIEQWFKENQNAATRGYVLGILLGVEEKVLLTTLGRMAGQGRVRRVPVYGEQAMLYLLTEEHMSKVMEVASEEGDSGAA